MSIELAHVYRGSEIESIHRGDIVGVDFTGQVLFEYGTKEKRTFWRSSAKPFQIIPFMQNDGMARFSITDKELALMTSSHGGEFEHVSTVAGILKKMNRSIDDLDCGTSRPMYEGEYKRMLTEHIPFSPANNPCSGKHSGMIGLAILTSVEEKDYILQEHPVQKQMLQIISQVCELDSSAVTIAIDGCGVPVFGLPILNMAVAYSKLTQPYYDQPDCKFGEYLKHIVRAMTTNPYYVAGTGRLDTILMEETGGYVLAKLGAESVYCMSIPEKGIGIAMKTEDGSYRALDAVIPDLLFKHDFIDASTHKRIKARLSLDVLNHRKQVVGQIRSTLL